MLTARSTPKSEKTFTVGIDLGGTKAAAALVDAAGAAILEVRRPTVPPEMANLDPRKAKSASTADVKRHIAYLVDALADAALEAATPLLEKKIKGRLIGIGLASAGPMTLDKGTLDYPSNLVGWKVVPLVSLFEKALAKRGLKQKVYFQNDAIAAALGEGWVGRAKGLNTYAMITVGTGIGTGVIFNGQPAHSGGMGSEWGHVIVNAPGIGKDPGSHNERTVEGIASGTGLIRRAKARGFKGESTAELAIAARHGDKLALELFDSGAEALAALLYSLSLGFHPEKFVVSGGMLAIKDLFLPRTIKLYRELMKMKNPKFLTPIEVSKLGTQAGVIGSARLPRL